MELDEFKSLVNAIRPSNTAADIWWEWAQELEEYDSPDGKPSPDHKEAEEFLGIFALNIQAIQKAHGDAIAGQIISLAENSACLFLWEMKVAAEYLALGKTLEEIAKMEKDGVLEDFSEKGDPIQRL